MSRAGLIPQIVWIGGKPVRRDKLVGKRPVFGLARWQEIKRRQALVDLYELQDRIDLTDQPTRAAVSRYLAHGRERLLQQAARLTALRYAPESVNTDRKE